MPGPGHRQHAPVKVENPSATLKRLISCMGKFKWHMLLVVALIAISAGAQVIGTSFLQKLIDDYFVPMQQGNAAELLRGLAGMLTALATVYLCGAAASYGYMRIMLNVSTGTLLSLRQQLFDHMEKLPIRYFDRNTHGDIMSRYTNDIDTIREMLSNSVANFISSSITVISVFIMMLSYSWQLTIVVIAMLFVMLRVVRLVDGKSGAYFVKQQAALGRLNGYIE